ncbi:hypothetical protein ACLOJK_035102 [Asimina triloba]
MASLVPAQRLERREALAARLAFPSPSYKQNPHAFFHFEGSSSVESILYGHENAPMEQNYMGDYKHSAMTEEHDSFVDADNSCFGTKGSNDAPINSRKWKFQDMGDLQSVGHMLRELYEQFVAVEDRWGFDCVGSGVLVAFTIRGVDEPTTAAGVAAAVRDGMYSHTSAREKTGMPKSHTAFPISLVRLAEEIERSDGFWVLLSSLPSRCPHLVPLSLSLPPSPLAGADLPFPSPSRCPPLVPLYLSLPPSPLAGANSPFSSSSRYAPVSSPSSNMPSLAPCNIHRRRTPTHPRSSSISHPFLFSEFLKSFVFTNGKYVISPQKPAVIITLSSLENFVSTAWSIGLILKQSFAVSESVKCQPEFQPEF